MGRQILFALWFFWPAGVATMIPVFAARAPIISNWNAPIDGGLELNGRRLLGDHKTWRGFMLGGLAGTIWFIVERLFYQHSGFVRSFCLVDYTSGVMLLCGVLLSFGAVLGDAVKSFFKRQIGVKSGDSWFPFDQLDHLLGGLLLSLIVIRLSLISYIYIVFIWFGLHLLTSFIGYKLKFKSHPI
jgi:CDP-2,3-bis-(O-geranylgeranyl)-sn-glycerol synthase